jgi:hypothetical protein
VISINILPDEVLLAAFEFCMDETLIQKIGTESWQLLVHVCRRWRRLVFGSPRRLKLRLACTARTHTRDMLDIWPPFPLVIDDITNLIEDVDNVIAALERRDRVLQIRLSPANGSAFETVSAAMQEPFPELTVLQLLSCEEPVPIVPDSFLGRSAPRLRTLVFVGISFAGLPNLLLSATSLVFLHLTNIPRSGYISPDAVVTALSMLTSLAFLGLQFRYPPSVSH